MRIFILIAALTFSSVALADQTYTCTLDKAQRLVTVNYKDGQKQFPCEVKYKKASGEQVLWRAIGQVDYCESQAKAFVAKQEAWGWTCELTQ